MPAGSRIRRISLILSFEHFLSFENCSKFPCPFWVGNTMKNTLIIPKNFKFKTRIYSFNFRPLFFTNYFLFLSICKISSISPIDPSQLCRRKDCWGIWNTAWDRKRIIWIGNKEISWKTKFREDQNSSSGAKPVCAQSRTEIWRIPWNTAWPEEQIEGRQVLQVIHWLICLCSI